MVTSQTTMPAIFMTDRTKQNKTSKGRPRTPDSDQLKPRFTLNLSDIDNELFEKAVEASGGRRSSLARQGVISIAKKILNIPE